VNFGLRLREPPDAGDAIALHHLGVLHCEYALLAAYAMFWASTESTDRIRANLPQGSGRMS